MTIRVWAPTPLKVEIEVGPAGGERRREPMSPDGGGWWRWSGDDEAAPGELDYAFVLDEAQPALPDPRSPWQPDGVDGPSRTFDTSAFGWTDTGWRGTRGGRGLLGGVVYELHVGTFTPEGTLDAAIGRLDHLVDLGADLVEVMPVAGFPGRWGWGYDGVDLFAVHDPYGGPAALQRFVDACHARGLGVCLDVVHNHLGPSGNYLARYGPYFTDEHQTPWGPAVNLDAHHSSEVRAFVVDSVARWLRDFHVDALRLDAVQELRDESDEHLLEELADAVGALEAELGHPLGLVAESDLNDMAMVTPRAQGGRGMRAQWDDDLHHSLHVVLTGETQGYYGDFAGGVAAAPDLGPFGVLAKVLTDAFLHDGRWSSFRGQVWGAPVDRSTLDGRRLLGYLQTHDQVGNRALGERIGQLAPPGRQAAGAALFLLWSGTPMIFMGEEWAASTPWQYFASFTDEGLAAAVSDGRRAEFAGHGWSAAQVPDPQDPATRDASVLRWSEVEDAAHARMLDWYAALIRQRRAHLDDGETRLDDVSVDVSEEARWVVMRHRSVVVVANLGDEQVVPLGAGDGEGPDLALALAWDPEGTALVAGAGHGIRLPADSAAVLVRTR